MGAREEAIKRLERTSEGKEAMADCIRFLDGIEAADPAAVDTLGIAIRRNLSPAAAAALLDALKAYRRELDRKRQWAANLMDSLAQIFDVKNPEID